MEFLKVNGVIADISYTRAPENVKLIPGYQHDSHSSFWALAKLDVPQVREQILANPEAHPTLPTEQGNTIPPDEQMLCYDYMYYLCASEVRLNVPVFLCVGKS